MSRRMSASESMATPTLPDLALGPGVVRVVAHLRGQVEGAGEAGLAGVEEELEALVGGLGRAEAGVLAHGPQLRAVHLGVDATGVGERPGLAQLDRRVPTRRGRRPCRRGGSRCPSRCGARGFPGRSVDSRLRDYGGSGPWGHPGAQTGRLAPVDDTLETTFSHFGICVSDLERSLRFYCDGLGFEKAESHPIGSEFAALMDLPDVAVTSQFIRRGPTAIELLAFTEPEPVGSSERRPVHQLGPDPPVLPGPRRRRRGRTPGRAGRRRGGLEPHRPSTSAARRSSSSTAPTPTACGSS